MKTKILESAKLDILIKDIAKRGAKLDADIQTAGVSAIAHHAKCGDTGFINRLYLALPKGARKAAMTSWLLAHAGVVANTEKGTKEAQPFVHAKDKASNPEAADADPWYDHKPDAAPDEVFDLMKAVQAVINKAGKAKSVSHVELLTQLKDMVQAEESTATSDDPAVI